MTNPFTSFAFAATGGSAGRTLPDRLTDIKNVKDFGAKGDGLTDDWAAIMAAFNWTVNDNRGTLFFPPGTYRVSQPLVFGDINTINVNIDLRGVGPLSTITGNFADYVVFRGANTTNAASGNHSISDLAITNTHATGGGIRWGLNTGASLRNLKVTANLGINLANVDHSGSIPSQETSIENCILSPGANPTNSIGIMTVANGPIANCVITGFQTGAMTWGQQGGHLFMGCRFELCGTGILPGFAPPNVVAGDVGFGVRGCYFKNCGVAIDFIVDVGCSIYGTTIESTNATVFGSTPQYGIKGDGNGGKFRGVFITGQFAQAGIDMSGITDNTGFSYEGVTVNNTGAGVNWVLPAHFSNVANNQFKGCSVAPVWHMGDLSAITIGVASASWSAKAIWKLGTITPGSGYVDGTYSNVPLTGGSGTGAVAKIIVQGGQVVSINDQPSNSPYANNPLGGTGYAVSDSLSASNANLGGSGSGFAATVATVNDAATLTVFSNLNQFLSPGIVLETNVQGISPAGYNGVFTAAVVIGTTTMTYAVANPGGSGGAGTALINPSDSAGVLRTSEGDCFNVNDASTATWGSNPVGGGSTHDKVRWSGTNWSVVGA